MKTIMNLTLRNIKLFFKDKGMVFSSLITPIILLVLYMTFLQKVYLDSFESSIIEGFISGGMTKEAATAFLQGDAELNSIIKGCVCAQLVSSVLAVSCITVSFCANLIMVQDKVTGSIRDISITPVKKSSIALSYYLGTFLVSLLICFATLALGFIYMALTEWYLTFGQCLEIILDVVILVLFGTALSSIVCSPLSTQGQMSAVGTIISAGYGFICGAYMPISSFGTGLQNAISLFPGTYGTGLIRSSVLSGSFEAMRNNDILKNFVDGIAESIDCKLFFFGTEVTKTGMYLILVITIFVLIGIYVLMNMFKRRKK